MDHIIKSDLYRYSGKKSLAEFYFMLFNPCFRYTFLYRKSSKYGNKTILGIFYRILKKHYGLKYAVQIPSTAKIGKGLYISHIGNIILNPETKMGENCNIAQGVTIGLENRGKNKGVPTIGNEVWIGANSVIVGKIKIGNNVLIAPNCFVNFDIPDNSIVISSKCAIHENIKATEDYIENKL